MFLSSKELKLFYRKTQFYSTRNLYELEYHLRYNNRYPIYNQMHKIVEIILIKRCKNSLLNQRNEKINYLHKCLSLSNPFGRFSARLIGYICKFIDKEDINNLHF